MMRRYVNLTELAYNLSLDAATAEQWVSDGILPDPVIRDGKRVWQWSKVERAMADDEGEYSRVYFMESQGLIKIGFTRDLARRHWELSNSLPHPVELLHDMPGSFDLETDLHRQFAHLRVRGEWFRKEPDLIEHIERLRNTVSICPTRMGV